MPSEPRTDVETPCAATGLLPTQKAAIEGSWALVGENAEENGVGLFLRLFESHPDVHTHFAKLRLVPVEKLRTHPTLINHAQKALGAISKLVENLNEPATLVSTIQELARDHKRRGITSKDFQIVLATLQDHLASVLGEKYDDVTSTAWKQCCDVIWAVVDAEIKQT
ncbi:hemoglobin-2-like isoform X2 [Mya arenaria]|nr:hemoglobin-2-like isoform X2 [Mya arenaria]XP_052801975.1 hemoglobin-2-like isoform X2 [Mya arenaria]XP_052801976.1 hemoglobin-2-like isoform X2 [Mya arenaria]